MQKYIAVVSLVCALFLVSSCATKQKYADLTLSTFINLPGVDPQSSLDNLPFMHSWVSAEIQGKDYTKLIIKPVISSYVKAADWERSESVAIEDQEDYLTEVKNLADFTTTKLTAALTDPSQKRFKIVQAPGPGTMIFEMSLSEVVFGKPIAAAGALAAPVPGSGIIMSALADPYVVYEVRLVDATTIKILATAADRAFSTKRLVNFNKMSATSACRDIMGDAVELITEVLEQGRFAKVKKRWFELKPW